MEYIQGKDFKGFEKFICNLIKDTMSSNTVKEGIFKLIEWYLFNVDNFNTKLKDITKIVMFSLLSNIKDKSVLCKEIKHYTYKIHNDNVSGIIYNTKIVPLFEFTTPYYNIETTLYNILIEQALTNEHGNYKEEDMIQFKEQLLQDKNNKIQEEKTNILNNLNNIYSEFEIKKIILSDLLENTNILEEKITFDINTHMKRKAYETFIMDKHIEYGYTNIEVLKDKVSKIEELYEDIEETIKNLLYVNNMTIEDIIEELSIPKSIVKEIINKYKIKLPDNIYSKEGERLDSKQELIIDNFFHKHNISHSREVPIFKYDNINTNKYYRPDWIVSDNIIIEYFGYYGQAYEEKTQRKIEFYKKLEGYSFIFIYPKDMKNLDKVFANLITKEEVA